MALVLRPSLRLAGVVERYRSTPTECYASHRRAHLSLIVAYTPTEDTDATEKDIFYDQLATTIQSVLKHDELLVLGDMNANPGPRSLAFAHVVGSLGTGSTNDNSDRLLTLCSSERLKATGSLFKRRDIHRHTWYSNDGRTRKELDQILARLLGIVKSYRVFRCAEAPANTDHCLLVADIAVPLMPVYKRRRLWPSRFCTTTPRRHFSTKLPSKTGLPRWANYLRTSRAPGHPLETQ